MNKLRFAILGLAILVAAASSVGAQSQYIGFVYPAGGEQGSTFPIRLGGQGLVHASDLVVSGEGVAVRLVDFYEVLNNQDHGLLRQQVNELQKKESTIDDAMVAKMGSYEFPAPIGPATAPEEVKGLICPACGRLNPLDATVCTHCNAKLEKPKEPKQGEADAKKEPPKSEKEAAKQKLIDRIESRFAEDERTPAVSSQTELVFVEVTVAPDAEPGQREIRLATPRGVSNPLVFHVGQLPEVARKPMMTCSYQVLGKEELALRKRPPEEEVRTAHHACPAR